MPASLDFAAPARLSAALASRGARNPDALADLITRKRLGLSSPGSGIRLGMDTTTKDFQGKTLTCPECGHVAPSGEFGTSGASRQAKPELLRTPAPGTGSVRNGAAITVRSGSPAHALAGTRRAVELAARTPLAARRPIHGPMDVLVKRAEDGTAVLKHRNGGATIAGIRKDGDGKWIATVNGTDLSPRDHQRTALMEAVGTWNNAIQGAARRQEALQPPPVQTPLMAEYGIPAMRSAGFATPTVGMSDGPRTTTSSAGSDDDGSDSGLSPKAQAVYKKLLAKGFPAARAMAFAKNSERFNK